MSQSVFVYVEVVLEVYMKKTKRSEYHFIYTDVYKDRVVQLYLKGIKKKYLIEEYEVSRYLLDKWIKQYNIK